MALNPTLNEVQVEGYLQEVDLTPGKDVNGNDYIRGKVIIQVDQSYSGIQHEISEVPISVYAGALTKKGTPNPAYASVKQLLDMKRLTTDGDHADWICLSNGGNLREFAFIPEGGENVISNWQIGASFFRKANPDKDKSRAVFKTRVFIRSMQPEVRNDEETGRLEVKGIAITWGGAANVLTFYIEDRRGVEYMMNNYKEGDTVLVGGRIRCSAETRPLVQHESEGFGEEIDTGVSRTVFELIITGINPPDGGDEYTLDEVEVREAMADRQHRIQENAANRRNANAQKNAAANASFRTVSRPGFGW